VKATLYWPNLGKFGMAPRMAHSCGRLRISVRATTGISFFQQKTWLAAGRAGPKIV